MAGLPPDDLPAESAFRSLGRLFASPFCGPADLVEECADEDDGVVEDEGAFYHVAGWEHSNPGLTPEVPSFRFPAFECRAQNVATAHCHGRWRWNCDAPWRFPTRSQAQLSPAYKHCGLCRRLTSRASRSALTNDRGSPTPCTPTRTFATHSRRQHHRCIALILTAPCLPLARTCTARSHTFSTPYPTLPQPRSRCPLTRSGSCTAYRPRHERRRAHRVAPAFHCEHSAPSFAMPTHSNETHPPYTLACAIPLNRAP